MKRLVLIDSPLLSGGGQSQQRGAQGTEDGVSIRSRLARSNATQDQQRGESADGRRRRTVGEEDHIYTRESTPGVKGGLLSLSRSRCLFHQTPGLPFPATPRRRSPSTSLPSVTVKYRSATVISRGSKPGTGRKPWHWPRRRETWRGTAGCLTLGR